jgi:uncharacterized protein YfiM (DUF2279 family)
MWSHLPPEPIPLGDEPERKPAVAPGPARPSRLLPVVQCLAEGGLLAVVAAAIQALFGEVPIIGPFEFAILAGIGMAWARRQRWRTPAWEAFGLPFLVIGAGTLCWILAPEVRVALAGGNVQDALGSNPGGWIGAVAVYRGSVHRAREADEEIQDNVMRVGLPVLAIAWLVGAVAARNVSPGVQDAFTAVAFIGSMVFVGAGVLALGLARLAAVRGDGPGGGSWFGFALAVALGVTVLGVPAALLLGVPLEMLVVALVAPIRVIGALFVLLLSPIILLAALFVDMAQGILPAGFGAGTIRLPTIDVGIQQPDSPIAGILFYVLFGLLVLLELGAVLLYLLWRWHDRRQLASLLSEVGEERQTVFERMPRPPRAPRPVDPTPRDRHDPVGAYLLALEALAADDRWARRPAETPRRHLDRVGGTVGTPIGRELGRLAAAYQLIRYGGRRLGVHEQARSAGRLDRLERAIRQMR